MDSCEAASKYEYACADTVTGDLKIWMAEGGGFVIKMKR
jgi:hypothetical protein